MAKTVTTTVTDDLDGSANAEEISFSYKGTAYTIDLGKKNASALDKALKPYLAAATKVPSRGRAAAAAPTRRSRRAAAVKPARTGDVAAIRKWAAANGHAVNTRGRISQTVRAAYEAAK
jgi:FAD/FMN-containing dehydrogenase